MQEPRSADGDLGAVRRLLWRGRETVRRAMALLRHGDYLARVSYDPEIDRFLGEVINTADVITSYGASVDGLRRGMTASIGAHPEACRAAGVAPGRPSTSWSRLPPMHRLC